MGMNTEVFITRPLDARELKARVDLVSLAGKFTRLRRAGPQFVGLCPLHSERHPSFYVDSTRWYCFGCACGGDVFAFVMQATGCDFRRALEIVSRFTGEGVSDGERSEPERAGGLPSLPPPGGQLHSQSTQNPRAPILAALDATNRRLRVIEAANAEASAAMLATACEPKRSLYLLEETK
jgi:hypothetical protein